MTPYAWLLDAAPRSSTALAPESVVALDLACGSGPLARARGPYHFVGIDRSTGELDRARRTGMPLVQGDAGTLPFADGTFDLVACSMALMLFDPIDTALAEIRRVLRPRGVALFLLPGSLPLTARDRVRYVRLLAALHLLQPSYANRIHLGQLHKHLARAELEVSNDERRRFTYVVGDDDAARLFAESLYVPGAAPRRVEQAARVATSWVGSELGIPLRRVACRVMIAPTTSKPTCEGPTKS